MCPLKKQANIWKSKKDNKVVGSDECSTSRANVIQLGKSVFSESTGELQSLVQFMAITG